MGLPQTGIIRDPKSPTGVALIVVDRTGANQIAVAPGSNLMLTSEEVSRTSALMAGARVLLVQLEIPLSAVMQALTLAREEPGVDHFKSGSGSASLNRTSQIGRHSHAE